MLSYIHWGEKEKRKEEHLKKEAFIRLIKDYMNTNTALDFLQSNLSPLAEFSPNWGTISTV